MIKKLSIVALILLVVGGIGSVATYGARQKEDISEQRKIKNDQVSHVHIDVDSMDLEFIPVNDFKQAKVELVGNGNKELKKELKVKEAGDTLEITLKNEREKWFNFQFGWNHSKLKIYLPEKQYEQLKINGLSADVYLNGISGKNTEIKLSSGDLVVKNVTTDKLVVEGSSSDLFLRDIKGDVFAQTKSGDMVLNNIVGSDIGINANSGDIALNQVVGPLQIKTSSGDIHMAVDKIMHSVKGQSSSGDIFIETKEKLQNARFDIHTNSGDAFILGENGNHPDIGKGSILIQLDTSSGDILIK